MTCRPLAPQSLAIDIVVHGRFHAFALARALIAQGHDVLVHTNYPPAVAARFGVPKHHVRSLLVHGVASRILRRVATVLPNDVLEAFLHRWFGRWAARSVRPTADIIYGFTGVMEEFLLTPRAIPRQMRSIVRGSSHIGIQSRLLEEEEARVGVPLDKPGRRIIAREEREYGLADRVFVLSHFAHQSFVEADPRLKKKLCVHPLGVDTNQFAVTADASEARRRRILSGSPLTVLTVGTFSYRKGVLDLVAVAQQLFGRIRFRFIGDFPPEGQKLRAKAEALVELCGRVPEGQLPSIYAEADIFLFPTIEDGFAAVLLQAASAGLPVIATTNCSAPDFIKEGETGWIVPIRDPVAITERLIWCDENRDAVAAIADKAAGSNHSRTWNVMASELIDAYFLTQPRSDTACCH